MRTNGDAPAVAPVAHEPHGDLKRVAASSFLGNFIEWFDYATYTYFAITIGQVFFPGSEVNSTLMAFAIFALAFIFRPLGAMFWGSMGDKKGRKQSLAISVLLMSGAAFLIGCLPSYQAIGLASPILLLCAAYKGSQWPASTRVQLCFWPSMPRLRSAAAIARSSLPRRPRACWRAPRWPLC